MNSYVLMLVLTAMTGGGSSAAFVETDSRAECEMRLQKVLKILGDAVPKGSPPVTRSGCFNATQRFEPFEHDTSNAPPPHHYLIMLEGSDAAILRQDDAAACDKARVAAGGERLCVQSKQSTRK